MKTRKQKPIRVMYSSGSEGEEKPLQEWPAGANGQFDLPRRPTSGSAPDRSITRKLAVYTESDDSAPP